MGEIFKKNSRDGLSDYTFSNIPESEEKSGVSKKVSPVDINFIDHKGGERKIKGRFVKKIPHYSQTGEQGPFVEFSNKINEEIVLEEEKKFQRLKEINDSQKPGMHRFNLPTTTRVARNENGRLVALHSDLTQGGRLDILDLKDINEHSLDQPTRDYIASQIKADMELAERNYVCLTDETAEKYPLDAWALTTDKQGGKMKLVLMDMSHRVVFDPPGWRKEQTKAMIEEALENLKAGKKIGKESIEGEGGEYSDII